ncbi:39639_t:CDS:2, partial [Gigaspora margarita]
MNFLDFILTPNELSVNGPDSPISRNTCASEKSNNGIPKLIYKKTKVKHRSGSKKRSWVWRYFELKKVIEKSKDANIEVIYSICLVLDDSEKLYNIWLRIVSRSISNLINYLTNIHDITKDGPKSYKQDDPKQTKIDIFARSGSYPHTESKNDKLTKELIKFFICNAQPISLVVSSNFCKLIKELDPMFSLSNEKHNLMHDLVKILGPFFEVTKKLGGSEYVTIFFMIPSILALMERLDCSNNNSEKLNNTLNFETTDLVFDTNVGFIDTHKEEEDSSKGRKFKINTPIDVTNMNYKIKNLLY